MFSLGRAQSHLLQCQAMLNVHRRQLSRNSVRALPYSIPIASRDQVSFCLGRLLRNNAQEVIQLRALLLIIARHVDPNNPHIGFAALEQFKMPRQALWYIISPLKITSRTFLPACDNKPPQPDLLRSSFGAPSGRGFELKWACQPSNSVLSHSLPCC